MKLMIFILMTVGFLIGCAPQANKNIEPTETIEKNTQTKTVEGRSGKVFFEIGENDEGNSHLPSLLTILIEKEDPNFKHVQLKPISHDIRLLNVQSKIKISYGCDEKVQEEKELPAEIIAGTIEFCGNHIIPLTSVFYKANTIIFNNSNLITSSVQDGELPEEKRSIGSVILHAQSIHLLGKSRVTLKGLEDKVSRKIAPPFIGKVWTLQGSGHLEIISLTSFITEGL